VKKVKQKKNNPLGFLFDALPKDLQEEWKHGMKKAAKTGKRLLRASLKGAIREGSKEIENVIDEELGGKKHVKKAHHKKGW